MEAAASLKQTITHLVDAVRFADHAKELEELARGVEGDLETAMSKLEAQTEELSNMISSMKVEQEPMLRELAQQLGGFLATAKEQAKNKLQKRSKQQLDEHRKAASIEKDKALKSLEAYLASDPIPIMENSVQIRLDNGVYEARSRYECEGAVDYEFRLASQTSKIFHEPLILSRMGYTLKIPVRFSRALLGKNRVPGFERLDQYILTDAESTGGKLRANFEKQGNGAKMKVVTSGNQQDGFVGLEYSDATQAVNIMNDPALVGYVDIERLKQATGDLVKELAYLSMRKVALLRLSINGVQALEDLEVHRVLQQVLEVMGPSYRLLVRDLADRRPTSKNSDEMTLDFLKVRIKLLGAELSKSVAQSLGVVLTQ
jgi:hypothetical protein